MSNEDPIKSSLNTLTRRCGNDDVYCAVLPIVLWCSGAPVLCGDSVLQCSGPPQCSTQCAPRGATVLLNSAARLGEVALLLCDMLRYNACSTHPHGYGWEAAMPVGFYIWLNPGAASICSLYPIGLCAGCVGPVKSVVRDKARWSSKH